MFINNASLAELLHSQVNKYFILLQTIINISNSFQKGYSRELIPILVKCVPSMHICLDFVPKLLTNGDLKKQAN